MYQAILVPKTKALMNIDPKLKLEYRSELMTPCISYSIRNIN
jgi:hypothetical protein